MADVEAFSVDALCGFGAKNLNRCTEFIQCDRLPGSNTSLLISHFGAFPEVVSSVLVRFAERCFMSGRASSGFDQGWSAVDCEASGVRRYAAVLSLGAPSSGMGR